MTDKSREIVISGLSGRFPNSDNVDQFWENLVSGLFMYMYDVSDFCPFRLQSYHPNLRKLEIY